MNYLLPYFLLLIGFALLIKGADLLVDGASAISRRFGISDRVIGLTLLAFGTSTPELFVNITASIEGSVGIAVGNVLGSNISNILLILGASALIRPLRVTRGTVWREIPFSLLAALALWAAANDHLLDGWAYSDISRSDGLIFLIFFAIFIYYAASIAHVGSNYQGIHPRVNQGMGKSVTLIIAGLIGLALGGKWIVDGAIHMASAFGMSEAIVGLTVVAVGTSLPELAASATAAYKGNVEMAVGNVVGSNIFNIFFVLGVSSTINPLPFHTVGNLDIGTLVLASLILFAAMFTGNRRSLDRWEGALLLIMYATYIGILIWRG